MGFSFHKMHGLGNDFAIFDCRDPHNHDFNPGREQIALYADRKLGIGFDQLIILKDCDLSSQRRLESSSVNKITWMATPHAEVRHDDKNTHDIEMVIFNADGSKASACGNAARCVGFLLDKESGSILCDGRTLQFSAQQDGLISVNMGQAEVVGMHFTAGRQYMVVDIGNLHAVTWVDDLNLVDVANEGALIANSQHFPDSVNVTFAEKIDDQQVFIKTWERGVGPTLACGSAACATAACVGQSELIVQQLGGQVAIKLVANEVHLTGPARLVYKGEV